MVGTAVHGNALACSSRFQERESVSFEMHCMLCSHSSNDKASNWRRGRMMGDHTCYSRLSLRLKGYAVKHSSGSSGSSTSQELVVQRVKSGCSAVALMDYDALSTEYEWGGLDFSQPLPPPPPAKKQVQKTERINREKPRRTSRKGGGGDVIVKTGADSWEVDVEHKASEGLKQSGTLGAILRKKMMLEEPAVLDGSRVSSARLASLPLRGAGEDEGAGRDEMSSPGKAEEEEETWSESETAGLRSLPPRLHLPATSKSTRAESRSTDSHPSVSARQSSSPLRSASLSPRRPVYAAEALVSSSDLRLEEEGEAMDGRRGEERRRVGEGLSTGEGTGAGGGGGGMRRHGLGSQSSGSLWEEQAYAIIQQQKLRELVAVEKHRSRSSLVGRIDGGGEAATSQRRRSPSPVKAQRGRGSLSKMGRTKARGASRNADLKVEGGEEKTVFASAFERLAHDLGIDRKRHLLVAYLQEELGLEPEDLTKIASRHRACLSLSVDIASARVAKLAAMGISKRDICRLVVRHPQALEYSSERIDAHAAYLRNLGVLEGDMGKVITVAPILLGYTVDSLQERVEFLKSKLNVHGEDLRKIILRSPQILTQSIDDSLEPRLCYLCDEVGVSRTSLARMVVRHPQLLHYSIDDGLRPRIAFLQRIGIKGDDVASVIARFSQVLSLSVENNLDPKYRYLVKWLGGGPKTVTSYPAYFSLSLGHRIRPRHLYLVSKKRMPFGPFPMKNLAITDVQFVHEVAKSSMEDYLEFRKNLSSAEEEGTAGLTDAGEERIGVH